MDDFRYTELLSTKDSEHANSKEAIRFLGNLIDEAGDRGDRVGLEKALKLSGGLEQQRLSSVQRLTLFYFVSNIWAGLHSINHQNAPSAWNWELPEAESQIVYLRRAIREPRFVKAPHARRCQVYTNLANILNNVGRSVEAIETWNKALNVIPAFGMAKGNLGKGLSFYGHTVYDRNNFHDSMILFRKALLTLREALELQDVYPDALNDFRESLEWLESTNRQLKFENHSTQIESSFGPTDTEAEYRKWAVEHRLFIHFLNDIDCETPQGAADKAVLPALLRPITEESRHFEGLFNQMKQEFVSARYLYFEGISSEEVHFADRRVALYNTLDYPSYSLAIEKIKIAFRLSYSILDKIAFFLNEYLDLKIKQSKVNFRTFWYLKLDRTQGLRSELVDRNNWPLRGLFWLSKDLFEESEAFRDSLEPEAMELANIRNHLEHKYLKVHEYGVPTGIDQDSLAYAIDRDDLIQKTLRLVKMARSALIYLILAVTVEEREREGGQTGKSLELEYWLLDDDSKF